MIPVLGADKLGAGQAAQPKISRNPSASTFSKNADARFYVNASSNDGGYLTYQWHISKPYADPVDGVNQGDSNIDNDIKNDPGASLIADGTKYVLTTKTPDVSATTYYYYWVTVTNNKDFNGDGDTDDSGERASLDSAFSETKVVNRTLFTSVQYGDFEAYTTAKLTDGWYGILRNFHPSQGFWNTTHEGTPDGREWSTGKQLEIGSAYVTNGGNRTRQAELSAFSSSTIYQEIATVPGKIYEWSIDHAARTERVSDTNPDVVAVVVGPAINAETDYDDMGVTNYWNKVSPTEFNNKNITTTTSKAFPTPFTFSYGASPTLVNSTCAAVEYGGAYAYGVNMNTHFNAIVTQVMSQNDITSNDYNNANFNSTDRTYTTAYGGKTYYVYISSSPRNGRWNKRNGVYTIPEGQGTTVFGFVSISSPGGPASGNILDNITFASGSPLNSEQDATFTGETQLSTQTKAGYAYALAEVRGSSVRALTGLKAFYDADGEGASPETAIAPTKGVGADGWYTTDSNTGTPGTAFANDGTITFKDLTPGATYRLIGIPILAINPGLQTNISSDGVLDDGYFRDTKIKPASAGDVNVMPQTDMEIYDASGGVKKVRLTLQNARADSEYALLAGEASGPDTSGPAHSGTAWKAADSGSVVFENLELNHYYYLVARPLGYTEIGYAAAAYDEAGDLIAIKIQTPPVDVTDIAAENVTRDISGTSVQIANTRTDCEYALVDPATGIILGRQTGNGATLTFSGLTADMTYRAVVSPAAGLWLKGVRVYPYADEFTVDFAENAVKSTATGAQGNIPAIAEYRIRANDTGATWLLGDAASWKSGTNSDYIELDDPAANAATTGKSVFDAIDDLKATGATGAAITYRYRAGADNYSGAAVYPERILIFPARPAAPRDSDFSVNYKAEIVTPGALALIYAQTPNAAAWTNLPSSGAAFTDFGWTGSGDHTAYFRFPAAEYAFASLSDAFSIKGRPAYPSGVTAMLKTASDPSAGLIVSGLKASADYEYRVAGSGDAWTALQKDEGGTSAQLPYATGHDGYDLRYPATADAPASFYITIEPTPLNISPINLGAYFYGDTIVAGSVEVHNITDETITIGSMSLAGDGASLFTLTPGDSTVPAAADGIPGLNDSYMITPQPNISAGNYAFTVNMTYTADGEAYTAQANVYLTVNKANWNMSTIKGQISDVTANSFKETVEDAPQGARLSYQSGNGAFQDGGTVHVFSDLNPATTYTVRVKAKGDANHNESIAVPIGIAYTAYATPVASDVIHVDYTNEKLVFSQGYNPADYTVKIGQTAIANNDSLTPYADDNFTLSIVRNTDGSYPASAAAELPVTGRADAPTGVTSTPATTDMTNDGQILLAGSFRYRPHLTGDMTSNWQNAYDSVSVVTGDYDVQFPPSATAFGSKLAQIYVGSRSFSVTAHTKTYTGGVLPSGIVLPAGWILQGGQGKEGQYNHIYTETNSPLFLPTTSAVTSVSHVFTGWYNDTACTGDPETSTPKEYAPESGQKPMLEHHDYYAKWVVKPMLERVQNLTPTLENRSDGLTRTNPIRGSVSLATDVNNLSASDLGFTGSYANSVKLYSDSDFLDEMPGAITLAPAQTTHVYIEVASSDDPNVKVYYDLVVQTTKSVSFTVARTGGTADILTTTGVAITFSADVTGLSAAGITIETGTGRATKGQLSGSGKDYTLAISDVAQGDVNLMIADWPGYDVAETAQSVEVYRDATLPTATVKYKENDFKRFLNDNTFGRFFKSTVTVEIAAKDDTGGAGDGIESIRYEKADSEIANIEDFTDWDETVTGETATFRQVENAKFILYVKVTDKAGNAQYYKDGIVVYTDSAQLTPDITYYKDDAEDVHANVTLNDNVIQKIANTSAGTMLTKDADYTVSGDAITFNHAYLDTLAADEYTLTVSYNPLGETYVDDDAGDDINEAPDDTTIHLTVLRNPQSDLAIAQPNPGFVYGDTGKQLSLEAGKTGSGTGTVTYVQTSGTNVAAVTSTGGVEILAAGKFKVKAIKAADENYNAAESAEIEITVAPAQVTASFSQVGGINGKALTTAIDIKFITSLPAITGFTTDHITLMGAHVVGDVARTGDDDKTFRVNITLEDETANGDNVSIELTGFGNYMLMPDMANPGLVEVYRPVKMPTPSAIINFPAERLEGLVAGKYYAFHHSSEPEFDDYHPASADGTYDISTKESWKNGGDLYIKRQAEGDTVDSDAQALTIPARPAAPKSDSITKTDETFTGFADGTITPGADMQFSTQNGTNVSDWTDASELTDENGVIKDLAPGIYYVRDKAVENTSFASQALAVEIAASFEAATYTIDLDKTGTHEFANLTYGYDSAGADALAQTVTVMNTGNQPTGVLTIERTGANADAFRLSVTSLGSIAATGITTAAFTVLPDYNLAAGTYTAEVTVKSLVHATIEKSFNVKITVDKADPQVSGNDTISGNFKEFTDRNVTVTLENNGGEPLDLTATVDGKLGGGSISASQTGSGLVNFVFTADDLNTLAVGTHDIKVSAPATANNNAISETTVGTITVNDVTAPTGEIKLGENSYNWRSFLNSITFGLFFKDTQQAKITATDDSTRAVSIQYYTTSVAISTEEEAKAITAWTTGSSVYIEPGTKTIVYAKLSDPDGNTAVINSDGIVVYEDSTYTDSNGTAADGIFTRLSNLDLTIAGFDFKGNTVKSVRDITGGAGNEISLDQSAWVADYGNGANGTLTIKNSYLMTLAVETYTFEVSYYPLGETADPTPDAPNVTTFTIEVVHAAQQPMTISGLDASYTYGVTPFTISVGGGSGSGNFTLRSNEPTVAAVTTVNAAAGQFTVDIIGTGTFTLTAGRSGDTNYKAAAEHTSESIPVDKATPYMIGEPVGTTIEFGQKLKELDISTGLGYTFAGTDMDGELSGTLAWKNPETADESEAARKEGIGSAAAIFTPAAEYADRYASLEFYIPMNVVANMATRTELTKIVEAAYTAMRKIALDTENYDAKAIERLQEMIAKVEDASNAGKLTQATADALRGAMADALNALTHSHPILANSAKKPITEIGTAVTVRIKGSFNSVRSVTLNGDQFVISKTSGTSHALKMNEKISGSLNSGSAIIKLSSAYVDSLNNGNYTIAVQFQDEYMAGEGVVTFVVNRTKSEEPTIGTPVNPTSENLGGNDNRLTEQHSESKKIPTDAGIRAIIPIAIFAILLIGALFLITVMKRRKRE
ncbi:MAG: hypothetical protein LBQ21_06290 [Clostridiales Family XIII bacterium]|jgi:hypothetical protein|nr:hypothetical protein [Clostridiales Family XIII bacterium]